MKKLLKLFSIIALLNLSLFAAGNIGQANVAQYSVNIKKLEIYNSTTGEWIVLSDTATVVDIASATVGESIGAMISRDAAMTFGTYTQVRATVGNTFIIRGCNAAGTMCTDNTITAGPVTSGQYPSGTHTLATAVTGTNMAGSSAITMVVDFTDSANITLPTGVDIVGTDARMATTLTSPFIVNEGTTSPSISVDFDVDNVLTSATMGADLDGGGNDDYIIIDFPTVTISIN